MMPRRGHLGETRNEHQVATAERFLALGAAHVAMDEQALLRIAAARGQAIADCRATGAMASSPSPARRRGRDLTGQ